MSTAIHHIAIMRLSAMGDVAMIVPVIRALNQQYPELQLTVISRPFFRPFFEGIPNLRFFAFEELGRHKGIFGLYRLFEDLKQLNIDAFADLHDVIRSKAIRSLFALSGKKVVSVDKDRDEKKALTQIKNKVFKQLPSKFSMHQKVFEKLGFPIDLSHPTFPSKAKINNPKLTFLLQKTTKLIGIAPFAQYESKIYPMDLMQKVIQSLAQNPAYTLILFGGGKKEAAQLEQLAESAETVINLAGKVAFEDELKIISHLDVMVSMDSGNGHIAAMLGVKVITLWGATHPYAGFLPFNQPLDSALVADRNQYPGLPTSVYGNKIVPGYEDAMRTILPEQVIAKIQMTLETNEFH